MDTQYSAPPATPVVAIDETPRRIRVATAHYPCSEDGYHGLHRAEDDRPPMVRLDRGQPAQHAAPDDTTGGE